MKRKQKKVGKTKVAKHTIPYHALNSMRARVAAAAGGELKIEHNVPLPSDKYSKNSPNSMSYYLRLMKPRDSIVLPTNAATATASAHRIFGKGHYAVRELDKNTARVWRLR